MPYKKNKIEAQKTGALPSGVQVVKEVQSFIKGIPEPEIINGKIVDVAKYSKETLKVIREYLLLRYNLGSDVHEPAIALFVDALQRWHIARDALNEHGDYQQSGNGTFAMHPAHRVKQMAEKTMNTFFMDFGLLPRQSFSRAEVSVAGGTDHKETDLWTLMATGLVSQPSKELN